MHSVSRCQTESDKGDHGSLPKVPPRAIKSRRKGSFSYCFREKDSKTCSIPMLGFSRIPHLDNVSTCSSKDTFFPEDKTNSPKIPNSPMQTSLRRNPHPDNVSTCSSKGTFFPEDISNSSMQTSLDSLYPNHARCSLNSPVHQYEDAGLAWFSAAASWMTSSCIQIAFLDPDRRK